MEYEKQRLEAFSDGVIAIIITIMVLSIPLPDAFDFGSVMHLLFTIFVYLLSFIVVGAFWNQHHQIFSYLDKITARLIAYNLVFLFFLSLIPILTKWVMENPGVMIPVICYDIAYLLTSLSYMFIFNYVIRNSSDEEIVRMRELRIQARQRLEDGKKNKEVPGDFSWVRFFITAIVVVCAIGVSVAVPTISTLFLLGLPVASSVGNLLFEEYKRKNPPKVKTRKGMPE